MRLDIVPHAFALSPKHQRDLSCGHGFGQSRFARSGQADAPETRFRHFIERPGEVYDTHPWHSLERT